MEQETLPAPLVESQPEEQQAQPTPEEQARAARRVQTLIIAGGIFFFVLLIAVIVLMAKFPQATSVIRDIAIVFVAVETFLIGLAVILLIVQIQTLIQVLRDEIQPLLRSVNDTASTVRGTTAFVSHNVVSPFIKLSSTAAAVNQMTHNLIHVMKHLRPRAKPDQSQTVRNQVGGQTDE
ncbi:MAG: hypothetical protein JXA33_26490 [Anaerolineae bacterium]|nr:hypothetical protein [Anaerolineae bacterium]